MNWMPVTVFQPTALVLVEKALLTPVARMLPAFKKSCSETTTRPRKGAGTISDWYVLGDLVRAYQTVIEEVILRYINLNQAD